MWIFHPLGFASVVADETNMSNLLVRGRFKGDLERLFPGRKAEITPQRDYRFRMSIPRQEVAARYTELMATITYDNFKDACPKDRHDPYLRIWSTLYSEQTRRLPNRRRKVPKAPSRRRDDYFDSRSYSQDEFDSFFK